MRNRRREFTFLGLTNAEYEYEALIKALKRRATEMELRETVHEEGSLILQNRISALEDHRLQVAAARAAKQRIPD